MSGRNSSLQQASGGRGHPQGPPQQGGRGAPYYPQPNYQYQQQQVQQQGGGLRPMPPGPTGMGWPQGGGELELLIDFNARFSFCAQGVLCYLLLVTLRPEHDIGYWQSQRLKQCSRRGVKGIFSTGRIRNTVFAMNHKYN